MIWVVHDCVAVLCASSSRAALAAARSAARLAATAVLSRTVPSRTLIVFLVTRRQVPCDTCRVCVCAVCVCVLDVLTDTANPLGPPPGGDGGRQQV